MVHRQSISFLVFTALFFAGIFFSPPLLALTENVALVNGQGIAFEKFRNSFDKACYQLETEVPIDPTSDEGKKLLLITSNSIMEELVDSLILELGAREIGVVVSPAEVDEEIASVRKGYPDDSSFMESLKAQNITFEELKENILERLLKEKVISTLVKDVKNTDRELTDYYQKHLNLYAVGEKVELNHILVFSQYRGLAALEEIQNGLSFEQAARRYSEDSLTRTVGGYLSFRQRKDFPEETRDLIFQLKPGEISPLLKTDQGYEIFQCLSHEPQKTIAFEEVKDKISQALYEVKKEAAFKNWFRDIKGQTKIEIRDALITAYIFRKNDPKK